MFKCRKNLDIDGTYYLDTILMSPDVLRYAFGAPQPGDGDKVYGEYHFSGPNDTVFTLYDWKEGMNLWGPGYGPLHLHIGGDEESRKYLADFRTWLTKEVENE